MFVGRSEELNNLKQVLSKRNSAVMIYGKRKVGKTTLIKEYMKTASFPVVYYECVKDSPEVNVQGLIKELVRTKIMATPLPYTSFIDLFEYLNSQEKAVCIVIDEYPYLKASAKADVVDSTFQKIIDNHLGNMNLILSGSHIGMMKDLLQEKNALYGRFRAVLKLKELGYLDSASFYPGKSAYEKAGFYCVFGGSPYINEMLDADKTLKDNIIQTILNEKNAVYLYADSLLLSDYTSRANVERIFSALGNGKKYYRELENSLGMSRNGNLHYQLKALTDMEIVAKHNPINRLSDPKKTMYEIDDNLMRFFFTYVYKNKSALQMLGSEAFYEEYIEPSLTHFISYRFETLVKEYFSALVKSRKLRGVRNIGSLYYDDPVSKRNGEFDVVLEYSDYWQIIEVKYYDHPMTLKEMQIEEEQVRKIPGSMQKRVGFAAASGFETSDSYSPCLDAEQLYTR